jgi:hypothetical protein
MKFVAVVVREMSIPAYEIRVTIGARKLVDSEATLPKPPGNPANKYRILSVITGGMASGGNLAGYWG